MGVVKELTPRHRGVLPLLTCPSRAFFLSPDPELPDEGAVALHVDVPQVVQQTPLLANQEQEAAAGVVVLGVNLQVLCELPDARVRKRDLDLGRTGVLLRSPVSGDQLALDFRLFCQTDRELYRPADDHRLVDGFDRAVRPRVRSRAP